MSLWSPISHNTHECNVSPLEILFRLYVSFLLIGDYLIRIATDLNEGYPSEELSTCNVPHEKQERHGQRETEIESALQYRGDENHTFILTINE